MRKNPEFQNGFASEKQKKSGRTREKQTPLF